MAEAKVLVLGGCGFVGRNLVAYLIENNLASMTKDGERIHQLVQSYAHQLAFDSSKCLSADDSDNDNCIFRPLPPVPSE
eukprot:gene1161-15516_t